MEIGFGTADQSVSRYIGHDRVGFAYNVFANAGQTGYWYGTEQVSFPNFLHKVGDVIEVVAHRDTGKVYVATYRNEEKIDHGLQITNENLKGTDLWPAINMQTAGDEIELGCWF